MVPHSLAIGLYFEIGDCDPWLDFMRKYAEDSALSLSSKFIHWLFHRTSKSALVVPDELRVLWQSDK